MKITAKTIELVKAYKAIDDFNNDKTNIFNGLLEYKLSKLKRQLEPTFLSYNETRGKLLNLYGEKDDKGNLKIQNDGSVTLKDANSFLTELTKIECDTVEIEYDSIPLSLLKDNNFLYEFIDGIFLFINED